MSHYRDRNSVCCFMSVIDIYPQIRLNEVSGYVMVAGHNHVFDHRCCRWRSLWMFWTLTIVHATPQFFLCFSIFVSPLFPIWWFIVESEISLTLLFGYLSVLSDCLKLLVWRSFNTFYQFFTVYSSVHWPEDFPEYIWKWKSCECVASVINKIWESDK